MERVPYWSICYRNPFSGSLVQSRIVSRNEHPFPKTISVNDSHCRQEIWRRNRGDSALLGRAGSEKQRQQMFCVFAYHAPVAALDGSGLTSLALSRSRRLTVVTSGQLFYHGEEKCASRMTAPCLGHLLSLSSKNFKICRTRNLEGSPMYFLRGFTLLLFLAQLVFAQQLTPILPDPKLTPGDTFDVTAQDVCVPGHAKKVRAVPAWLKRKAYVEYGITQYKTGDYEVDHLIPLSLGGSNSIP
jgi:hypothetical protein